MVQLSHLYMTTGKIIALSEYWSPFYIYALNEKQTENSDWAVWFVMLSLEKS